MIRIIGKIPHSVDIACSGGIDSMAITKFLQEGRRDIRLLYFNHDTQHSYKAEEFVKEYARENKLELLIGRVKGKKGKRSFEEFWRDERYAWFSSVGSNFVVTCHHLDDCLETWLMSSFHGTGKLIPYSRNSQVYRPFLMTDKKAILDYSKNRKITWIEDPSNQQIRYVRNRVRHNIIPEILKINPGIRTVIRKKLLEKYRNI